MQNISLKSSIKKSIFTIPALIALMLTLHGRAQAVEVWSNNNHTVEITGDFHYGLFHSSVSSVEESYEPVDVRGRGEVDVDYQGIIDSDLSAGFKVEAKIDSFKKNSHTSGFTHFKLDENYIYLRSKKFGKLLLGSDKGAAGDSHVRAPEFLADDLNSIEGQDFKPLNDVEGHFNVKDETDIDYDEDFHKIIYYTPRIGGFEFGISYTPNLHPRAGGENNKGLVHNNYDETKHGVALTINYHATLSGMEIAASAGYLTGENASTLIEKINKKGTHNRDDDEEIKHFSSTNDPKAWSVGGQWGAQLGAGMFKIGGGYLMSEHFTGPEDEESVLIVGTAYEWNQWKFGIHYRLAEHSGGKIIEVLVRDANDMAAAFLPRDVDKTIDKTVNEIEIGGSYRFNPYTAINAMAEYAKSEISGDNAEGYTLGMIFTMNF